MCVPPVIAQCYPPCAPFIPQATESDEDDGVVWMTDTSAEAAKRRAEVGEGPGWEAGRGTVSPFQDIANLGN
jgi:hypothetical protein